MKIEVFGLGLCKGFMIFGIMIILWLNHQLSDMHKILLLFAGFFNYIVFEMASISFLVEVQKSEYVQTGKNIRNRRRH